MQGSTLWQAESALRANQGALQHVTQRLAAVQGASPAASMLGNTGTALASQVRNRPPLSPPCFPAPRRPWWLMRSNAATPARLLSVAPLTGRV